MAEASNIRAGAAYVELGVSDFGLRRGLQQASALVRKFAATMSTSFRVASASIRLLAAPIVAVTRTMQTLVATAYRLASAIASVAWSKFKTGMLAVAVGVGIGIKSFASFEKELANVASLMDNPEKYMAGFKKGIRELSKQYGESANVLASGLYDIISASVKADKAMFVLEKSVRAATAGLSDTKTAADVLTTLLNSFGYAAEDVGRISDLLFITVKRGKTTFGALAQSIGLVASIASKAGLSLEETAAGIATMTQQGVKTDEAITALNAIISSFLHPASDAKKIARELGFEMSSAALSAEGLRGVFEKMSDLSPDEIAKVFPNLRALRGVLPALANMSGFVDILNEMEEDGDATGRAFDTMSKTLSKSFDRAYQRAADFLRLIGEAFAPLAGELLLDFTSWIDPALAWLEENLPTLQKEILWFWDDIKWAAIEAWWWIEDHVLKPFKKGHESTWDTILRGAIGLWEDLKIVWDIGTTMLSNVVDWVKLLFNDPKEAGKQVGATLLSVMDMAIAALTAKPIDENGEAGKSVVDKFVEFMNGMVDELKSGGFTEKIQELLIAVFALTGPLVEAVSNWAIEVGKTIGAKIRDAILNAVKSLGKVFPGIGDLVDPTKTNEPSWGFSWGFDTSGIANPFSPEAWGASSSLASGGLVTEPTMALIGEAGPEAVIPLTGRGDSAAAGGAGTMNVNINVRNPMDPAVVSGIKKASERLANRGR